jgi:hypothetical protein
MSDLVERLRSYDPELAVYDEAADRIEALEAALQRIVEISERYVVMPSVLCEAIGGARAALAPEQNKCVHSWSAPFDGVVKCVKCGTALAEEQDK